jgi:DNA-binding response OmpR family regulator
MVSDTSDGGYPANEVVPIDVHRHELGAFLAEQVGNLGTRALRAAVLSGSNGNIGLPRHTLIELLKSTEPGEIIWLDTSDINGSQTDPTTLETSDISPSEYLGGYFTIDHASQRILVGGAPISVGRIPFNLAVMLTRNAGKTLSKEQLNPCWGVDYIVGRGVVAANMSHLRVAVGNLIARHFITVPTIGYVFHDKLY